MDTKNLKLDIEIRDQKLPSKSDPNYKNNIVISGSEDEPNFKRSGINEINSGKDIIIWYLPN